MLKTAVLTYRSSTREKALSLPSCWKQNTAPIQGNDLKDLSNHIVPLETRFFVADNYQRRVCTRRIESH